jgi:predicted house-cleaning noncanonical NTP pyrophosphatase (MazG superfamily)
MEYSKLVRDKIPGIIKKANSIPIIHKANKKEFEQKLIEKLTEEIKEFKKSGNVEELADLLEIIYAICDLKGEDKRKIESIREKKAKERGAFKKQIILERTKK